MDADPNRTPSELIDRRTFVKGAVAATSATVAASYVKPELRAIGVSQAIAVSPSGEEPPEEPPVLSRSSSLSLSTSATASPGSITGQVCVTNESDDNGSALISSVQILVEPKRPRGGFGGKCGDPKTTLLSRSSSGGLNPLAAGTVISGPTGKTTCFTIGINDSQIQNVASGDDYRVHVVVAFGPHHVHGTRETQVCTTVNV